MRPLSLLMYFRGNKNGKELSLDNIRHSKSKTESVSDKYIYKCKDCSGCPYKKDCIKGNNCKTPLEERNKVLQVAKKFIKQRQEDLERITSEEGIQLRVNRSIQAEGSFGDLKQDMQFRRYLSKGSSNVLAEGLFSLPLFRKSKSNCSKFTLERPKYAKKEAALSVL